MSRRALTILGSTGTIGVNALDLVARYPEHFEVAALSAGRNVALLAEQVKRFHPKRVAVADKQSADELKNLLGSQSPTILYDEAGICEIAASAEANMVICAIVGFAGVRPTLAAITAGKQIALANKEAIIAAGPVMLTALKKHKARLIPVDSEHSAIFQALYGNPPTADSSELSTHGLKRLVLTASGGPFRDWPIDKLADVTPQQALKHPTWQMGAKITIDSATMMNKGLEVIEATRLFGVQASQIDIVVHPESIIHSIVEFVDGSMLAQLGVTDMRGPLAFAMAFPQRLSEALPSLSLAKVGTLRFMEPDFDKFPALRLAFAAAATGKSMPAVLNAANEVGVEAFLKGKIGFTDIARLVGNVMQQHDAVELPDIESVCEVDAWARREMTQRLTK